MRPARKQVDESDAKNLRAVLRRIGKEQYFDWVLTKSHTNTIGGKIVQLDLSWLGIRYLPPEFLHGLNFLQELRLDNNPNCEYARHSLAGVPQLMTLKLRYCQLRDIPTNAFGTESTVKNFQVEHNPLGNISSDEFHILPQLELLDISDCHITSLSPRAFSGLMYLRKLLLENNNLRLINDQSFEKLHNLNLLNLQRNQIEHIDPYAFESLRHLEILKLNTNHLTGFIDHTFDGLYNLQSLSIFNNQIQDLKEHFTNLPELINLSLDSNFLQFIGEGAFQGSQNLSTLDFQFNHISKIHKNAFSDLEHLEMLNLAGNPLETESALYLPGCAKFDYSKIINDIDGETIHNYILSNSENRTFIAQAMYSGKLLDKTWAYLRLIGY